MKEKINKRELWTNLKRTWKFASKEKKTLFLYFFMTLITSGLWAIVPIFSAKLLLNLTAGLFDQLILIAIILFALEISGEFFGLISNKIYWKFFKSVRLDLQNKIIQQTLKLEIETIDKNSLGVFVDRITNDTNDIVTMLTEINGILSKFVSDLGILVAIYIINKYVFIYFLFTVLISFLIDNLRISKFYKTNKEVRKIKENNHGLISELIRGIRDIKVLNAGKNFSNKMSLKLEDYMHNFSKMYRTNRKYNSCVYIIQKFSYLGYVILSVFLIRKETLTIASAILLYEYQYRVYNLLKNFAYLIEELKKFDLAANRVYEIMYTDNFKKETFGNIKKKVIHGDFEFKNVSFSYNEKVRVLKNISFKVKANETVAFVGKSGSGKSTIFSLMTKLYNINQGVITIDGIDIKEYDEDSLRGNISIINQMPYIFNFSIRENLKIVKDNLTEKDMIKACKLARFHDFVMSLPDGYDTIVGEGGITLSGGQRQRLAIARALIKKTEIILFDEATSALDNETQYEIQRAINNMKRRYTILIIAHRLSTVINSDRIILIDKGKIIAEGSHEYLLNNNELYKKLYETELKK